MEFAETAALPLALIAPATVESNVICPATLTLPLPEQLISPAELLNNIRGTRLDTAFELKLCVRGATSNVYLNVPAAVAEASLTDKVTDLTPTVEVQPPAAVTEGQVPQHVASVIVA